MTKLRSRYRISAVICSLLLANLALAHDWSPAQKEVWKTVEAYNAAYDRGDIEAFVSYFHNDYRGWIYTAPVPMDRATVRKFVEYGMKTSKVMLSNLTPAEISIFGNVAVVHYFWTSIEKGADGKEETHSGRWTDILMKQGDKWMLIGDHGGQTSKN